MTTKMRFDRTETVICSIEVTDQNGNYFSPSTSMKMTILDPNDAVKVDAAAMTLDGVGLYHYDFTPAADAVLGWDRVRFVATHGSRVTIHDDGFTLEE